MGGSEPVFDAGTLWLISWSSSRFWNSHVRSS